VATGRISDEPGYVLHHYDWSESSLILEVFTRHHGRIALVAKGAKRPSSNFRPVLLPLQPLRMAFGGDAEIRTLKGAEWVGGHVMPTGEALLSGYYVNELVLRLLARDDPHAALFDVYALVVQALASAQTEIVQPALRSFELLLLREIGLLPVLDAQTMTLATLNPATRYCLVPEGGLRQCNDADTLGMPGAYWQALQTALDDPAPFGATARVCATRLQELRPQLRGLLNYHCGVKTLQTRQLMMDLQNL
jgi:DNA repair protein RecO (recombination protein O)